MSRKYKHIMSPLKVGNVILKSRLLSANALPHFLQGPELYPSDAGRWTIWWAWRKTALPL